jgi:hypothetical protein
MNNAGVKAIRSALSNVQDNLYRYRHFGTPDQLTGNGETFASVIAALEQDERELQQALTEVEKAGA